MKKIGIVMGSDSDLPVVEKAMATLEKFGVPFEAHVYSAHRTPVEASEFAKGARANGFGAIIAAAGKAAHLAGAMAANTTLPVIGIPIKSSTLDGLDALLSTVQMPGGLPVATVAIDGAENAALLAIQILAVEDATLAEKLDNARKEAAEKVLAKKDGTYRVELERDIRYVMMASARGYLNQNFELRTGPEEKNETYIVDFYLSPISKPVVIENIFYDFDKATLRPESQKALDEMIKMLNDNPNVTIELGAHTDRKGSDQYNERLAQRRAQSVVDYLIAGGIDKERLEAKGYGESVPKVINKKMAKSFDFLKEGDILTEEFILTLTPEQQEMADQINRRTEFKVLRTNYNLF